MCWVAEGVADEYMFWSNYRWDTGCRTSNFAEAILQNEMRVY